MSYRRGDVVWGPDPFKSDENPRPWLILNNDTHPFGDEEYMTVTLTTTPHDQGIPLNDADWGQRPHPTSLTLTGSLVEGGACPCPRPRPRQGGR
jgi:hypothetical protein